MRKSAGIAFATKEDYVRVKILNPEILAELYKNHGEFACTCYDTPKKYAERVGESCQESGHMSGSRCEYIKFEIEGDRGTLEQMMRHEIGVRYDEIDKYAYQDRIELIVDVNPCDIVKNMQSFRYVDKNDFTYTIPNEIAEIPAALEVYADVMGYINTKRKQLRDILLDNGVNKGRAVECANFMLPRATNLVLTIGLTPEALIQFMWKRLCTRAQPEIREIAIQMKMEVEQINPQFAKELVPHCVYLLWCPEKETCEARPTKAEITSILMRHKGVK